MRVSCFGAVLLLAGVAQAAPELGRIVGTVSDGRGGVGGAAVVAAASDGQVERTARTAPDGSFVFDEVVAGTYHLIAVAEQRQPSAAVAVAVTGEQPASVSLQVGAPPAPPRKVTRAQGAPLDNLPLQARTPATALRLASALRTVGGNARPSWRLDGFDFTHPLTGGLALPVGMAALESVAASDGWIEGERAQLAGPRGELRIASGDNRLEGAFTARALDADGHADGDADGVEASVSGPLLRDRAWLSLDAAGVDVQHDEQPALSLLAKATWQVTPRNKLSLLGLGAADRQSGHRGTFAGGTWESLMRGNVFVASRVGLFTESGRVGEGPQSLTALQCATRVEYFATSYSADLHARVDSTDTSESAPTRSAEAALRNELRISRHLVGWLTIGVADVSDAPGTITAAALAWDATGDGRTVLRARAGHATAVPRGQPTREAATGIERAVGDRASVGAELLSRGTAAAAMPLVALHTSGTAARMRFSVRYLLPARADASHELVAVVAAPLARWMSFSTVVARGPRGGWHPLFDAATHDGGWSDLSTETAWLLNLQLRAELGGLLGRPAALWIDALDLTGDRGTLGTRDGEVRRVPGREVRLGLTVEL